MSTNAFDALRRPLRARAAEKAMRWEAPQTARAQKRARRRAALGKLLMVLVVAGALVSVVWRQTEGVGRQRSRSVAGPPAPPFAEKRMVPLLVPGRMCFRVAQTRGRIARRIVGAYHGGRIDRQRTYLHR